MLLLVAVWGRFTNIGLPGDRNAVALARERHQSIQSASVAMKPRESRRQAAASEKIPEFLLDEPRQAFSVAQGRRLGAERLEVLEDETVEHALRGTARLVRGRPPGHVNRRGRPRARVRVAESGVNS